MFMWVLFTHGWRSNHILDSGCGPKKKKNVEEYKENINNDFLSEDDSIDNKQDNIMPSFKTIFIHFHHHIICPRPFLPVLQGPKFPGHIGLNESFTNSQERNFLIHT